MHLLVQTFMYGVGVGELEDEEFDLMTSRSLRISTLEGKERFRLEKYALQDRLYESCVARAEE